MSYRVTGTGLLSLVADCPGYQPSRLVGMAGYIKPNGKLSYVDFYESLIAAKQANGTIIKEPDLEHNELTPEQSILWDHIKERLSLDDAELDDIFNEITDLGIETVDQFDDAYVGCWDSWDAEARFSEDMADSLGLLNEDHFFSFAIDWQRVWEHSLSYDYHCIAGVYFFNSNF